MKENYKPFTVEFVGDYFSMRTSVELDLNEPDLADQDDEDLMETAEELARNLLLDHYGWDMNSLATVGIEVFEG